MRLTPVAARLSKLLGKNVALTNSCIGDESLAQSNSLSNGDVLLIENVLFFG
jgi:phosphoglycerate kinase